MSFIWVRHRNLSFNVETAEALLVAKKIKFEHHRCSVMNGASLFGKIIIETPLLPFSFQFTYLLPS